MESDEAAQPSWHSRGVAGAAGQYCPADRLRRLPQAASQHICSLERPTTEEQTQTTPSRTKDMSVPSLRPRSILALLAVAAASCAREQRQLSRSDIEAVRETVLRVENEMNHAVDALNCDPPESGDWGSGDREPIFVSSGHVVRTSAEFYESCKRMVAKRTGAVFAPDRITANVLSGDVAYVVREGNYTVNRTDGTTRTPYLVMTTIWHREGDAWKMVHLHESVRRDSPATGSSRAP